MRNRCISMLLILTFAMGLLGCASQDAETTQEAEEPITFTFYNADGYETSWTDPVALAITDATGVTLDVEYPTGKGNDIRLMIATEEYPDLIFAKGDAGLLIDNDALIDMSDLIDQYGPHIKALYGDDYESLRYSEEDPSIYQLTSGQVQEATLETSGTAQLQWAVLAYNDYQIPTTLEEYTEEIKNYMAKYPTINNENTIGISIEVSDWYWYTTLSNPSGYIANGSVDDGQWIVSEDGTVTYKHAAEGQKEYFQWLNEMYNEGILDPDFATQTHEDYIEKIASGRVLGLLDAEWDYATAETTLSANDMEKRTYCGLPVTIDSSVTCASLRKQSLAIGWGVGITKNCKDPVRAIKFIDWLCTEEAQILLNWGIEGVNYYYDNNGKRVQYDQDAVREKKDSTYSESTGVGYHLYPFPSYGNEAIDSTGNHYTKDSEESVIASYNEEEQNALKEWNVDSLLDIFPQADTFDELYYSPLWSKVLPTEIDDLESSLDAVAWPDLVDCIVCTEDEFETRWEKLQQDLIDHGRLEAEALLTKEVQKEIAYRKSLEE